MVYMVLAQQQGGVGAVGGSLMYACKQAQGFSGLGEADSVIHTRGFFMVAVPATRAPIS